MARTFRRMHGKKPIPFAWVRLWCMWEPADLSRDNTWRSRFYDQKAIKWRERRKRRQEGLRLCRRFRQNCEIWDNAVFNCDKRRLDPFWDSIF